MPANIPTTREQRRNHARHMNEMGPIISAFKPPARREIDLAPYSSGTIQSSGTLAGSSSQGPQHLGAIEAAGRSTTLAPAQSQRHTSAGDAVPRVGQQQQDLRASDDEDSDSDTDDDTDDDDRDLATLVAGTTLNPQGVKWKYEASDMAVRRPQGYVVLSLALRTSENTQRAH